MSRKIIPTDTEGQAHTEENGGQKQKEDTNSEEDSETPVQEILDVEVMMLSGAENTFRARETVHLEKGEQLEPKLLRRELFRVKCPKRIVAGDPYYFETVPPKRLKKLVVDYTLPKSYEARLVLSQYEMHASFR